MLVTEPSIAMRGSVTHVISILSKLTSPAPAEGILAESLLNAGGREYVARVHNMET